MPGFEILLNLPKNGLSLDFDAACLKMGDQGCQFRSYFEQILSFFLEGVCGSKSMLTLPPIVGDGRLVDLCKLFLIVRENGGYDTISKKGGLWSKVAEEIGLEPRIGSSVKLVYSKYLHPLDRWLNSFLSGKGRSRGQCGGNLGLLPTEFEKELKILLCLMEKPVRLDSEKNGINWVMLEGDVNNTIAVSSVTELGGDKKCFYANDENGDLMILDPTEVDGSVLSLWKRKREDLSEMLHWINEIAKDSTDATIGTFREASKKQEADGSKDFFGKALLARNAILQKDHGHSTGENFPLQTLLKMHPSMYEDIVSVNHLSTKRLRCSQRLSEKDSCLNPESSNQEGNVTGTLPGKENISDSLTAADEVYNPFDDGLSRQQVRVGLCFQAELSESIGPIFESDSKWLGAQIWPLITKKQSTLIERDSIGMGRQDSCHCQLPGSVECVRFHIAENRMRLKLELGTEVFYRWRFHHIGEEVSLKWTKKEEAAFKDIVRLNPPSMCKCFLNPAIRYFCTKSRETLVSYYFNVFVLRQRSYQNWVTPNNVGSDDESEFGYAEPSLTPGSGTSVKLQSMHDTVMPDTFSFPTGASNRSSNDEPCSSAVEFEPHTRSNTNLHILSVTSAGSNNQQLEPSISVKVQCHSQTSPSLPPPKSENDATTSRELVLYESEPNPAVDIANSSSNVHVEVVYNELQQRQDPDSSHQALQSDHKYTSPWRPSEDGYNWRKYGQKHIKGSEFPRSYYKCSHANCQVKKQVERSHNGRITEVVYKGKHDHPRPQSNIQMSACTMSTIQAERSNGVSFSNNTKDKSLNGHGQSSVQPKPNGASEVPLALASHNNVESAAEISIRVRDAVDDDDDLESKRRRLNSNPDTPERSEDHQHEPSVQPNECLSQATASSCSVENVNASLSSHELTLSVTAPNPSVDVLTSGTIVPFGADSDDLEQRSDSGVQAVQSDHKGTTRFVAAEKLWGDGYQWRKYGQKHIKGSEFPRSYYRCTHPNCQVKKQLERSHDGQITDIMYKGEHDHPKPQPSSHMAVGRILSIQEEGSNRFSSLSSSEDKSLNRPNQLTHHAEPKGGLELTPILAKNDGVQGEGLQSNHTGDNRSPESSSKHMMLNKEININTAADSNHKQDNASTKPEGQCQSQTLVSSPSAKTKITDASCHELTSSITASNPPVYMVTSRGIVPVEVDSDELRQRQGSDSGVQSTQSDQNGISIAMTERLLENAYHWRKYGQKNIKGSEFPRSYYRCTYSGCQVKMQLERSHDGRIIEIIYKGKHDHPKPQPISRMAIGAILSLEEEKSDRFCLSHTEGKSSNGHPQTSLDTNQNGTPELSHITAIDDDVECAAAKLSRKRDEVENDSDPELKHRKKDTGDVDLIPVVRAPKEARIVVETLSDFDVVDDGYRWQKYGRKMVKGNPNPRNYYRCSNAACPVKKHVERASHNPKAIITTYEGKHNHDLPPPRSIGQDIFQKIGSSDVSMTRCEENDAISLDVGIATSCDPENKSNEKDEITVEPLQTDARYVNSDCSKVTGTHTVLPHNGDLSSIADPDTSRKDEGESFSFDTPSLKMES